MNSSFKEQDKSNNDKDKWIANDYGILVQDGIGGKQFRLMSTDLNNQQFDNFVNNMLKSAGTTQARQNHADVLEQLGNMKAEATRCTNNPKFQFVNETNLNVNQM